jgi:hypothetical protein
MILGRIGDRLGEAKGNLAVSATPQRHLSITPSSRMRSTTQLFASERNF